MYDWCDIRRRLTLGMSDEGLLFGIIRGWAECVMVMGRNGYGPKWLWVEMTWNLLDEAVPIREIGAKRLVTDRFFDFRFISATSFSCLTVGEKVRVIQRLDCYPPLSATKLVQKLNILHQSLFVKGPIC